jgi:hypothetical protein
MVNDMSMNKSILAGTFLFGCLGLQAVYAHEGLHGPAAKLDLDLSGGVTFEEFKYSVLAEDKSEAQVKALFTSLDLDNDYSLNDAEYMRGLHAQP